jgi:hypothetical protein
MAALRTGRRRRRSRCQGTQALARRCRHELPAYVQANKAEREKAKACTQGSPPGSWQQPAPMTEDVEAEHLKV